MKKSILVIKSLMVMTALFMVSCISDDDIKCPEPLTGALNASESEFSGSWKFSGMMADDAVDITNDNTDNPSKDIFAQYSACERDLVYDFMSNRNYSLKQGYLAPDCNNKQSLTGTWSLTSDDMLNFVANCSTQINKIVISEAGDTFSYATSLNFREASGAVKTTKVTYTYEKIEAVETPE